MHKQIRPPNELESWSGDWVFKHFGATSVILQTQLYLCVCVCVGYESSLALLYYLSFTTYNFCISKIFCKNYCDNKLIILDLLVGSKCLSCLFLFQFSK